MSSGERKAKSEILSESDYGSAFGDSLSAYEAFADFFAENGAPKRGAMIGNAD
jgi:hypothetical protein